MRVVRRGGGGVWRINLMIPPLTGLSKCAGLIRYTRLEDACNAVAALNGIIPEHYDRPLEVKFAENSQAKEMRQEKCAHPSACSLAEWVRVVTRHQNIHWVFFETFHSEWKFTRLLAWFRNTTTKDKFEFTFNVLKAP